MHAIDYEPRGPRWLALEESLKTIQSQLDWVELGHPYAVIRGRAVHARGRREGQTRQRRDDKGGGEGGVKAQVLSDINSFCCLHVLFEPSIS